MADCSLLSADIGQKNLLAVFEPLIIEHLNQPSRIVPHLQSIIPLKIHRDIADTERYSQEQATKLLLKELRDSSNPQWFEIFKQALAKEHFMPLYKRLNLEDVKDGAHYERLLQFNFPSLLQVQPMDITKTLLQNDVITRRDIEEIEAKKLIDGATGAMQKLLLVLPVRHEHWFDQLIHALKSNNYQLIVDDIHQNGGSSVSYNQQLNQGTELARSSATDAYQQHDAGDELLHSTQSVVQSNTSCVWQYPAAGDDMETDGPPADDMANLHDPNPELFDFISTCSTSTGRSSPSDDNISVRTDENSSTYGSVLSGTSLPDGTLVPEPLFLRGYQEELTKDAVQGKNCLIIAPTGSGKTLVGIAIAQWNLESATLESESKVAFFVPTKALVEQQFKQFIRYLKPGYRCQAMSGDEVPNLSLRNVVEMNDVLIMTPQILLNALDSNELQSLSAFSLLVFDECHHMKKRYPYNDIMARYYVDLKLARSPTALRLPQVVGLTASPGAGNANSAEAAAVHILKLCANMDALHISTVRNEQNRTEMMKFIKEATEGIVEVKGRVVDPFFDRISQTMKQIEIIVQKRGRIPELAKEIRGIEKATQPPAQRGSLDYVTFVSTLKGVIALIYDQKIRRVFFSCRRHLEVYNNALLINADCRTKDALEYIRKEFAELSTHRGSMAYDETDRWLDSLFTEMEQELDKFSRASACENPKLNKLQEIIMSYYAKNENAQGIVFCKTREMTFALMNWMKDSPSLAGLNPHNITGSNTAERQGMTLRVLEDVLQYFKGGLHKILVATSVAEEGLDVQKCNYVIRYLHVTNDIARIQSRGRARADNAHYTVVGDRENNTVAKDEANRLREKLTISALQFIDTLTSAAITQKINDLQRKAKTERDIESRGKEFKAAARTSRTHEGEYQLRCLKCDNLCGWSADIRTVNNQHFIIVDATFEDRVIVKPHQNPLPYSDWVKKEKISCKKCLQDWGIKGSYKLVPCCVIKICSFVVIDPYDKRSYCKKWKDRTFPVAELSDQDMKDLMEIALEKASETRNPEI